MLYTGLELNKIIIIYTQMYIYTPVNNEPLLAAIDATDVSASDAADHNDEPQLYPVSGSKLGEQKITEPANRDVLSVKLVSSKTRCCI